MNTPKRLRVVSDGRPQNTRVFVGDEELRDVVQVAVTLAPGGRAVVTLEVFGDVELVQRGLSEEETPS